MLEAALLASLLVAGLWIVVQDYRSLEIEAWIIYAYTAVAALIATLVPLPGVDVTARLVGGALGAGVTGIFRIYFLKVRKIEGLGEADIWVAAAAGFLVGPFLLGPWLFVSSLLAAAFLVGNSAFFGVREHPDEDIERNVIPLTPIQIATSFAIFLALLTGLVPADQIPLL